MKRGLLKLICAFVLSAVLSIPAQSQDAPSPERVESFLSEIKVLPDASMEVRESITVNVQGLELKGAIQRDLPTRYSDRYGNSYSVDIKITGATKDENRAHYVVEDTREGKRITVGSTDFTDLGQHVYTITYRVKRAIGYFRDHDELFWNVTGSGWNMPINKVSAFVTLPSAVDPAKIGLRGYVGTEESILQAYTSEVYSDGRVHYESIAVLPPHHSLFMVVSWPKGFVRVPSGRERFLARLSDSVGLVVGLLGFVLVLGYYLIIWSHVSKGSQKGGVVPRYSPPEGVSPAGLRYLARMGFDVKALTVALVDMAVKRYVQFREKKNTYTIERTHEDEWVLTPDEREVSMGLLAKGHVELEPANRLQIAGTLRELSDCLDKTLGVDCFRTQMGLFAGGAAMSAIVIFASLAAIRSADTFGTMMVGIILAGLTAALYVVISGFLKSRSAAFHGIGARADAVMPAGCLVLLAVPIAIVSLGILIKFLRWGAPEFGVTVVALVLLNALFYEVLRVPTPRGKQLLDGLEGFAAYLRAPEREPTEGSPKLTEELFERYLPYAVALDLEQAWSRNFSDALTRDSVDPRTYRPEWYSGRLFAGPSIGGSVASLVNSLSAAVSSSASAQASAPVENGEENGSTETST